MIDRQDYSREHTFSSSVGDAKGGEFIHNCDITGLEAQMGQLFLQRKIRGDLVLNASWTTKHTILQRC